MTTKTLISALQLATKREARASGTPGPNDIFYSSTDYNLPIPENATQFVLCGSADGTGNTYVDDKLVVAAVNGSTSSQLFTHDYSNGNSGRINPMPPTDVTSAFKQFVGQSINLQTQFIDLYKNSKGGSNFFLCIYA